MRDLIELVAAVRTETDALAALLPDAAARQWSASPVPRPREDTTERATGGPASDPTADTVLDPRRLAVRDTVARSRQVLRETVDRVHAVRVAMTLAVDRYDGDA
ncbi:DUF7169 domain-containing protein [Nocardioides ochotonae]|uniref:DUF7169 domain-containing protein n=1 Tax=Nocardioides ochotonae TaxID=2685869 RepID=UPI00140CF26B|nr:hypothetical protein [Nocardioides ochotonae]